MTIRFDQLPENGNAFQEPGLQRLTLVGAEMATSKAGNEQMIVYFETPGGTKINEYYQTSSNFMLFKLRRLMEATDSIMDGDITLRDICKILPRGKVIAGYLKANDRGYGEIDYSNEGGEGVGLESLENGFGLQSAEATLADAEQVIASAAPKLDIASEADTFPPLSKTIGTPQAQSDQKAQPEVDFDPSDF